MSIIGPRPRLAIDNERYQDTSDVILQVKPGITGWSQVCGLRGEARAREDVRARYELDRYYVEHWSLGFELKILLMTLRLSLSLRAGY